MLLLSSVTIAKIFSVSKHLKFTASKTTPFAFCNNILLYSWCLHKNENIFIEIVAESDYFSVPAGCILVVQVHSQTCEHTSLSQ